MKKILLQYIVLPVIIATMISGCFLIGYEDSTQRHSTGNLPTAQQLLDWQDKIDQENREVEELKRARENTRQR